MFLKITGAEVRFSRLKSFAAGLVGALLVATSVTSYAEERPSDAAIYAVTYIDVGSSSVTQGVSLLKRYGELSRHEAGNVEFNVLQETLRPNRFVVFEGWKDQAAFDAHSKESSASEFQKVIKPILIAPPLLMMPFYAYVTSPPQAEPGPGAVYMVEHMDFWPPFTDTAQPLVKALAEASEKEAGVIRYDSYQWRGHHYTTVAVWRNSKAFDAHEAAIYTREFRKASEVPGGRIDHYEERLYKPIAGSN